MLAPSLLLPAATTSTTRLILLRAKVSLEVPLTCPDRCNPSKVGRGLPRVIDISLTRTARKKGLRTYS